MCLKVHCALGKLEIEGGGEEKRKFFFSLPCISLGHFLFLCLYSVLLTDFSLKKKKKSLKQREERPAQSCMPIYSPFSLVLPSPKSCGQINLKWGGGNLRFLD